MALSAPPQVGTQAPAAAPTSSPRPVQRSFDDLGVSLFATTFVVLDLETTGLSPERDRITEVGAVKVRGGEVLGEFHCLVHPGVRIPSAIAALTGITDHLVRDRPPIEAALPALLEFLLGSVFVAHNAHFDLAFLQATCRRLSYPPLALPVVDTARLARRVLPRDEVRDHRLATLAQHLRARVTPNHRALPDARATVDVLHGLLERVGPLGVGTLEELRAYTRSSSDPLFRKRSLVADAPDAPGVYRFLDARGEVLYVGKAVRLRERLRQYFGQDRRRRIADLVRETAAVRWELAPTELEAQVRELRAIHHHRPRYNRRSRGHDRAVYVKLTREPFPRLSIVTAVRDDSALHVGPLPSRGSAERFVEAVHDVIALRPCTPRLSATRLRPACVLKELGRCGAPCDGTQDRTAYARVVASYERAVTVDPSTLLAGLRAAMLDQARRGRFERAQRARSRLHHVATLLAASRRVGALVAVDEVVAARVDGEHLEVVLVRRGRLAASDRAPAGSDTAEVVARLRAQAPPPPPPGPPPRRDVEEIELVAGWLDRRGVVVIEAQGTYASSLAAGRALASTVREARRVARAVRRDRQVIERRKILSRSAS